MTTGMLSPREPLTDDKGNVTRTWWRFFNTKITQIGTTATDLVVQPSVLLTGATVSSGGTIAAADLPGGTLIGNPLDIAGQPQAVPLDPSLDFAGTALGLASAPPNSLMGNAGTVAAIPGDINIGSGLTLDPASRTLSAGDSSGGDDETLLYSMPDRSGQVAALEHKVNDALALALLNTPVQWNAGIVSTVAAPLTASGGTLTVRPSPTFTGTHQTNPVIINTSTATPTATHPLDTDLMVTGPAGAATAMALDAFGGGGQYVGRRANGTPSAPTALITDNGMVTWRCYGYGATGYPVNPSGLVGYWASENWSDTAQGTRFSVYLTANGTTGVAERVRITGTGHVLVGTTTDDGVNLLQAAGGINVGSVTLGATGPTWTQGTVAPTVVAPVGSLYSRVGGAVGATLYVSRGGGTWAAVAGV
jgi:hypothetical protein